MTLYLFEADGRHQHLLRRLRRHVARAHRRRPDRRRRRGRVLLGTTERDDGEVQVTYAGHPLYYYAPDEAPGDTLGQEVGDVWYVVDAEGAAVE